MLLALIYAAVRALLHLLLVRLWCVSAADLELLVLRHEARMWRSCEAAHLGGGHVVDISPPHICWRTPSAPHASSGGSRLCATSSISW